jgi:hypothetical protein
MASDVADPDEVIGAATVALTDRRQFVTNASG